MGHPYPEILGQESLKNRVLWERGASFLKFYWRGKFVFWYSIGEEHPSVPLTYRTMGDGCPCSSWDPLGERRPNQLKKGTFIQKFRRRLVPFFWGSTSHGHPSPDTLCGEGAPLLRSNETRTPHYTWTPCGAGFVVQLSPHEVEESLVFHITGQNAPLPRLWERALLRSYERRAPHFQFSSSI